MGNVTDASTAPGSGRRSVNLSGMRHGIPRPAPRYKSNDRWGRDGKSVSPDNSCGAHLLRPATRYGNKGRAFFEQPPSSTAIDECRDNWKAASRETRNQRVVFSRVKNHYRVHRARSSNYFLFNTPRLVRRVFESLREFRGCAISPFSVIAPSASSAITENDWINSYSSIVANLKLE